MSATDELKKPTCLQMAQEAIKADGSRNGTSKQAILKYIVEKNSLQLKGYIFISVVKLVRSIVMTIIMIVVVVVMVIIMVVLAPHIMNHRGREVQVMLIASCIMNHRGSEVHVVLIMPHMNHWSSVVHVMLVVPYIMDHRNRVVQVMLIDPVDGIPSWHSIHGTAGSSVHGMGRVGIGWP